MNTQISRKSLMLATVVVIVGCGESHRMSNPALDGATADAHIDSNSLEDAANADGGARHDAADVDGTIFSSDAGADGSVIDAGRHEPCESDYAESAFVPDRLADAWQVTVARGTIRSLRGIPSGEGRPDRLIDPRPNNCGGEPAAGFAWDGQRCRAVRASFCRTQPCATLHADAASCQRAHATCEPELCRATSGVWTEAPVSCGAWSCGLSPVSSGGDCRGPARAHCACPIGESFGGSGCTPDSCIPDVQLGCRESNGIWHGETSNCGDWSCGVRPACRAIIPGCDCGPMAVFNRDTTRCEPDSICTPSTQLPGQEAELCTWSGGTWNPGACGSSICGVPSALTCASGGCDCGPYGVFDAGRFGCVLAPTCRTNSCF